MKPAAFDYYKPRTLDEALALLEQHGGDAKPLAGGQSLIPAMNFRLATPAVLVDLNELHDLAHIAVSGSTLRIGGMTRQASVERSPDVHRLSPLLAEALPFVAHPAIRNRGTIGGSLAHADPAAELPAVMTALDATFTVTGTRGSREIKADEFFTGLFATGLEPGELLTNITIAAPAQRSGFSFLEFSRRHGDFALAGVAAAVALDERGRCAHVRIALLGVGERPALAATAAAALMGQHPDAALLAAAAHQAAVADIDPPADIHASSRYRRQLTEVLTRRALERAFARCA